MAQLLISDLNADMLRELQVRASAHGQSPEAEAREILLEALTPRHESSWEPVNVYRARVAATRPVPQDSAEFLRQKLEGRRAELMHEKNDR